MLSLPVPRALYSFTKGFNGRLAIGTAFAPVESGAQGKFRPLSLIPKEISSVSPPPQHASSYQPQTPRPLRAAGIRWNPLFVSELRERIASVTGLRNSASVVSQTGVAGVSHHPDPDSASARTEACLSLAKDDGPAVGKALTSVAGHAEETVKPEATKAAVAAALPASRSMWTKDLAPLISPGLVLAQQRAFDRSSAVTTSAAGTASAAPVPPARSRTRPLLVVQEAAVHSNSRPFTTERNTAAEAIYSSWSLEELRAAKAIWRSWPTEELRDIQRTAQVERMLSGVSDLCSAADERTRAMSDARLAIDLSRTFGDRLFSPDEVRAWRRDIASMSERASQFLKERDALVAFTHLDHERISIEERSPSGISQFSQVRNTKPVLIITDSVFKKGETHSMLQMMRAMALGAERRDTLVFPLADNQDPVALVISPPGALRELDAFCHAGIRVHGKLLSGQADADIDRVAVRLGNDLPDGLVDHPFDDDARKEALKALQRDDRQIEAIIKSNCDSLVQYVLRCGTSIARLKRR